MSKLWSLAVVLVAGGCDHRDPASVPCVAGAQRDDAAGYCLKVPAAYAKKLPAPRPGGMLTLYDFRNDAGSLGLWLTVQDVKSDKHFEFEVDGKTSFASSRKDVQTGVFPGGGRWWSSVDGDHAFVSAITRGATKQIECDARPKLDDPDKDALIEACKSLIVTR